MILVLVAAFLVLLFAGIPIEEYPKVCVNLQTDVR